MTTILNLTQHAATAEQLAAGVVEPADKREVSALLTFESLPSGEEVITRAEKLAQIAKTAGVEHAMIGGAPYLMGPLEEALWEVGVAPRYSFSTRESVEQTQPDGSVQKVAVFRHTGWVLGVLETN